MREILEARIRDPKTSARDLASLSNALAKLEVEAPRTFPFPPGTLFVQPSGPEGHYQILARKRGGFERLADGSAWEVVYLVACLLGLVYTEEEARAILAERDALSG